MVYLRGARYSLHSVQYPIVYQTAEYRTYGYCEKLLCRLLVVVIYAAADDVPNNSVDTARTITCDNAPHNIHQVIIQSLSIPQHPPFDLAYLLSTPL